MSGTLLNRIDSEMLMRYGWQNMCSWSTRDPRYHGAAGVAEAFAAGGDVALPLDSGGSMLGCGFAIRLDDGPHRWKVRAAVVPDG